MFHSVRSIGCIAALAESQQHESWIDLNAVMKEIDQLWRFAYEFVKKKMPEPEMVSNAGLRTLLHGFACGGSAGVIIFSLSCEWSTIFLFFLSILPSSQLALKLWAMAKGFLSFQIDHSYPRNVLFIPKHTRVKHWLDWAWVHPLDQQLLNLAHLLSWCFLVFEASFSVQEDWLPLWHAQLMW